jgi:predicted RNase H-like nuclease
LISAKIKEVDDFLTLHAEARDVVRECHPELLFWSLNGGRAMEFNKKEPEGYRARLAVLTGYYAQAPLIAEEALRRFLRKEVAQDDVLDALAGGVAAYVTQGSPLSLPEIPDRDSHGLPMEMVYVSPMHGPK